MTTRPRVPLLDPAPPRTVGDLFNAVGVALDALPGGMAALGRVASGGVAAAYAFDIHHENPVASVEALRARALVAWTVTLASGLVALEARLAERFGAPRAANDHRVYGTWMVRSAGPDAGVVSFLQQLPDWAEPPPDAAVRARALADLAEGAAAARDADGLARVAAGVPGDACVRAVPALAALEIEIVPAIGALELAALWGWQRAVGYTGSVHQATWDVGVVTAEHEWGMTVTAPPLGPWRVVATLTTRPAGATLGRAGPAPVLALGDADVVRHVRIVPR